MIYRSTVLTLVISFSVVTLTSQSQAQVFPISRPFASFPPGGGLISIDTQFEFETAGLDFQSPEGNLIPVPDSVGPSPFTFFLSNTPIQVTYGNLGSVAMFPAGRTELSVGAEAGADDIVWSPGGVEDSVRELLPGPIATFPLGGGPISIFTSSELELAGLDFQSPEGNLIPVESGNATPFTFFLSNTPTQVTYGNLGSGVTFAAGSANEMSVGAVGGAEDIIWFFGDGPGVVRAPRFETDIQVREQIPEPSTGSMLSMVLFAFAIGWIRKRRAT